MAISNLMIVLLAILGIYSIMMSKVTDQFTPNQQRGYFIKFALGIAVILATFIPSPDIFGPEYRFTVSMGQLLLAFDLGPLLLFRGIPDIGFQPDQFLDKTGKFFSNPLIAGVGSSLLLVSWHIPSIFESASQSLPIWIIKEVMLVVAGLFLWLPVAGPIIKLRAAYPIQLLYLFIIRIPMVLIGTFFIFAGSLLYTTRPFAQEICAPSSIADQQLGGLVMSSMSGLIGLIAFGVVFSTWYRKSNSLDHN